MPTIPPHIIDEVRFATDVVDLVSEHVTLKKSGRNYFGLCPFHGEKTPSFSVNPEKQIFHCFGCGVGGNVFAFIQRIEDVSFPEAVRTLAKRAGISIPEPEEKDHKIGQEKEALYFANQLAAEFFENTLFSKAGELAHEYMKDRGFDDDALRNFGIGFAPGKWDGFLKHSQEKSVNPELLVKAGLLNPREKDGSSAGYYDRFRNRVMFPIHNLSGRCIAFGGRRIIEDNSPKYINSPETLVYHKGHVLYGFHLAREAVRKEDSIILVEGYLDVMRMQLCGFKNTVATSGTALTPAQARTILRYTKNVVMLYDSDAAGSAATLRGADVLVENGLSVRIASLAAGEDPDSFLLKHPVERMKAVLDDAPTLLEFKTLNLPKSAGAASDQEKSRTEQVRSIIETLAKMESGLERQSMVHRMAEKLKVDEAVLWEEVGRLRRMKHRSRRSARTVPRAHAEAVVKQDNSFAARCRTAELELIRIMILYWDAIRFIFGFMRIEDFHDPLARELALKIHEFQNFDMPLEPQELVGYFNDPEQAAFVSSIANEERFGEFERDYRSWSADCMARLQKLMLEDRLSSLQQEIKEAEQSGRDVSELMVRFFEVQKQHQLVKAGNFLNSVEPG